MSIWKWNKAGLFVGGMLFATKGVELLKSKTAHKAYVDATAFGLRVRDDVMKNVTALRENCEDIYAEAVAVNEAKFFEKKTPAIIEDESSRKAAGRTTAKNK